MGKRKCEECGTEIEGRVDKRFCSDQCRNTFNNRMQAIPNKYVRKVNYLLRKNRRILEKQLENSDKDAIRVNRRLIQDEGFNFEYFTNIYKTKTGNTYFFNFEYGYMRIDEDYLTIVRRDDYLKS